MIRQSHDEWFLEQVRQALIEADDPLTDWVPHEIVKTDMQRQREALRERILDRQGVCSGIGRAKKRDCADRPMTAAQTGYLDPSDLQRIFLVLLAVVCCIGSLIWKAV